jgi:hypothetical protein
VLDVAFGIYRQHLATLITIAVVLTGLPLLVLGAGGAVVAPSLMSSLPTLALLILVFIVGYLVLAQLSMGATVLVIAEGYLGRTLSATDAMRRTVSKLGMLIVSGLLVGLLVGLGMVIGIILLFIPGLILLCGLILTTQVVMLESPASATAAMGRAWGLSRGSRWRILLLLVVAGVLMIVVLMGTDLVVSLALGTPFAAPKPGESPNLGLLLVRQGIQLVMNILVAPLPYCFLTVAYYDARVRKEGFDLELLAASLPT